jgi:drug/metabolite transporter (DMT)-like permease
VPNGIPHAGEAAALATAVSWSFSAVFFSAAARRVGASPVNLIRLVAATGMLACMVAVAGAASRPPASQVAFLALSGVVGLALGDEAWFRALRILGPRRSSLVSPLWPVFAAVAAWPLLGETIGLLDLLGMGAALGGVLWVQGGGDHGSEVQGSLGRGLLFGVLACLGQAVGYVLAKPGLGKAAPGSLLGDFVGAGAVPVNPLFGTLIRMAAGTAWILVSQALRGGLAESKAALADRPGMWLTLGGTITGPVLGVWMSLVALDHSAKSAIPSTILATSPLFVIPLVRVVHGTPITVRAVVGSVVAIGGVALLTLK